MPRGGNESAPQASQCSTTRRPAWAASQNGAVSSVTAGGMPTSAFICPRWSGGAPCDGREYTLTSATVPAVASDRITLGAAVLPEPDPDWLAAAEQLPLASVWQGGHVLPPSATGEAI